MRRLLSNGQIIRRQSILFIVPILLLLAFMLAACGTNSGSGTSTGAGGSTPTAPTTVKDTATGCPSNAVITTAPANPNVTIRLTNSNGTVVAHNGDLIEVREVNTPVRKAVGDECATPAPAPLRSVIRRPEQP